MIEKWVFPCNTKYFDIIEHFKNSDTVVFKRNTRINIGDVVYIYLAAPIQEIRYICHVINNEVSEEILKQNTYVIPKDFDKKEYHFVMFQLDKEIEAGLLPYAELKENDIGQVIIPARASRKLKKYLDSKIPSDQLDSY